MYLGGEKVEIPRVRLGRRQRRAHRPPRRDAGGGRGGLLRSGLGKAQSPGPLPHPRSKLRGTVSVCGDRENGRPRGARGHGPRHVASGAPAIRQEEMKMKKPRALKKGPKTLPKFKTPEEEIRFFETHDMAPYWDQLETIDEVIELAPT